MKLEHVAISVSEAREIEQFYLGILGMREIKNFKLDQALSRDIFGIEKETSVFQLEKDKLLLEIFITSGKRDPGFNHICISTNRREEIFEKATSHSYKCLRLKRGNSDMIFITDHSGNIFEVKTI